MGRMERIQETLKLVQGKLDKIGFPRMRRSVAQLSLAFFTIIYFLVSMAAEPEWRAAFVALSLCYFTAFLAVGSEWFWGRWFASGLGWSGMMVGVFSLVTVGWIPALALYALLHAVVVFTLKGKQVAALYDGQTAWRARYDLDEYGASRLGKTITRASASLPALVIWALGPKEPGSDAFGALTGVPFSQHAYLIVVPALVVLGLVLLLRMRSVGLLVLFGGAVIGLLGTLVTSPFVANAHDQPLGGDLWDIRQVGLVGFGFLLASLMPFVRPVARVLGRRSG